MIEGNNIKIFFDSSEIFSKILWPINKCLKDLESYKIF